MSEILSGGLNWGSTQQAIVTMDKDGHPLTCCNPVTGECLGGGGSSEFSTAKMTLIDIIFNWNKIPILDNSGVVANQSVLTDGEYLVPLYNGKCTVINLYISPSEAVVSGAAEFITDDDDNDCLVITGDFSITGGK